MEFGFANAMAAYNGRLYFHATDTTYGALEGEIWRTDGTPEGTEVIEAYPGPQSTEPFKMYLKYDMVYFWSGYFGESFTHYAVAP